MPPIISLGRRTARGISNQHTSCTIHHHQHLGFSGGGMGIIINDIQNRFFSNFFFFLFWRFFSFLLFTRFFFFLFFFFLFFFFERIVLIFFLSNSLFFHIRQMDERKNNVAIIATRNYYQTHPSKFPWESFHSTTFPQFYNSNIYFYFLNISDGNCLYTK